MNSTGQPNGPALAVLRRLASARPAPPDYQRCEMCGEQIPDEHSHVVNLPAAA